MNRNEFERDIKVKKMNRRGHTKNQGHVLIFALHE